MSEIIGPVSGFGAYQTACEASPHKTQIDIWINENKSNTFISKELAKMNSPISEKSVAKYRKYREEKVTQSLQNDPLFQGKMQAANQMLVDRASQVKQIDVVAHLSSIIEHNAELLETAREDDSIKLRSAQDIRYVQMSILDAIKAYGEVILKAQKFGAIQEDPSLLRPTTINVNVKSALKDILMNAMKGGEDGGFAFIDRIRAGIIDNESEGYDGDSMPGGPSSVD